MSEPMTDGQIRDLVGEGYKSTRSDDRSIGEAAFDAWLAEHDRQVREQVLQPFVELCDEANRQAAEIHPVFAGRYVGRLSVRDVRFVMEGKPL